MRAGTLQKFESKAMQLERVLGVDRDVLTLELVDLERYVDARRKDMLSRVDLVAVSNDGKQTLERVERTQPVSDHTIAMELAVLLAALRRMKKHGLYDRDPAELWPDVLAAGGVYTPRDRWLADPAELERLLAALPAHRRRYITLYTLTGVRFSELYQCARIGDVLRVKQTKGNARVGETKTRDVPLNADARALLDADPLPWPLYHSPRMNDELKTACAKAGIARVSANDLRRTFVSWLANAGVPELTVIRLVGHNSSKMVRAVYAQLAPQTLSEAVDRLPRLGAAARAPAASAGAPRLSVVG